MSDPTEEQLIARVLAGDEGAFRTLFRLHSPTMYAVALRMVGGQVADAEDAVQEAWLRGVRGLGSFRRESSLKTWLVGIAVRCALEICRRRRPGANVDVDLLTGRPRNILDDLDLDRAIAALPDGYRQVLVLHDLYGYTHAEIGGLLEIDEGTSKSQLSRAKQAIRRMLGAARADQEQWQ